jgi:hypothetical protein
MLQAGVEHKSLVFPSPRREGNVFRIRLLEQKLMGSVVMY